LTASPIPVGHVRLVHATRIIVRRSVPMGRCARVNRVASPMDHLRIRLGSSFRVQRDVRAKRCCHEVNAIAIRRLRGNKLNYLDNKTNN
jgi:hypothetical protein